MGIFDISSGAAIGMLGAGLAVCLAGAGSARGTGIGLAVCDEIVTMHGGELTLENALCGGTLVTVKLPAAQ